jgi:putative peptidoglycan lipid II flippase
VSEERAAGAAEEARVERSRLVRRAGIVGAGTFASRVLGLVREMVLAALFSRDATDAFFAAFTIPNALRQLLAEGAVSSALVPVLSAKLANEGDESARAFVQRARGVSLVALGVATVLGMVFATPLTELFAGGYHSRPGEFERTVAVTRWVFPYIFFMGTAAVGMACLHAKKEFAVASFAPGLLNVAQIAAAFALIPLLVAQGIDPVHALTIGALVGGALQVVAQWPSLRRLGFLRPPRIDFADPSVREMLRRMGPMTFGVGVYYIDLTLSRRFLSELGPGAQSYFNWAQRLCDFPQGIFVMALSTAALPSLAALAAQGATGEIAKTYAHGMRLAMFVALPASVLMVALSEPVVAALFQRGAFDGAAARETAKALVWQGGAIWTVAAVRQTIPVFYALGETRTPVIVSALDLLAFLVAALLLRGPMGHVGISVAIAVSSAVQMVLLVAALRMRIGALHGREIAGAMARTAGASLVAAAAGIATVRGMAAAGVGAAAGKTVLPGVASGVVFGLVFLVAAHILGSEELRLLSGGVRRRLARRRTAAGAPRN